MALKLITNAQGVCETIQGKQFYRAAENQSDWKIFLLAQLNDDDDDDDDDDINDTPVTVVIRTLKGVIESVRIKRVMLLKSIEQNRKEIKEDISIVNSNIFNLHRSVTARVKPTETL